VNATAMKKTHRIFFFLGVPARAGYVREATRFKATRDTVDVPSRDQQVIDNAVASAIAVHLPQTIARAVFTTILNSSVSFELCVVSLVFIN
jgi:chorismate mutase